MKDYDPMTGPREKRGSRSLAAGAALSIIASLFFGLFTGCEAAKVYVDFTHTLPLNIMVMVLLLGLIGFLSGIMMFTRLRRSIRSSVLMQCIFIFFPGIAIALEGFGLAVMPAHACVLPVSFAIQLVLSVPAVVCAIRSLEADAG